MPDLNIRNVDEGMMIRLRVKAAEENKSIREFVIESIAKLLGEESSVEVVVEAKEVGERRVVKLPVVASVPVQTLSDVGTEKKSAAAGGGLAHAVGCRCGVCQIKQKEKGDKE